MVSSVLLIYNATGFAIILDNSCFQLCGNKLGKELSSFNVRVYPHAQTRVNKEMVS